MNLIKLDQNCFEALVVSNISMTISVVTRTTSSSNFAEYLFETNRQDTMTILSIVDLSCTLFLQAVFHYLYGFILN